MNKLLRILRVSLIIILGGMLVPALLSIVFSGFKFNLVAVVNFDFFTGLFIALIGGVLKVSNFSRYRKKVLKTPMDFEIESEKDKEQLNWPDLLFYNGLVIVLLALALGGF